MAESANSTRIRSPSYPYIDLETAIERIKTLYDIGKRSAVSVSVILPRWGYGSKSANGMKVVAALKNYGLIDTSGKKESRKIAITDRAYRILKDHPNSKDREQAIKDAALAPEMYSWCWNHYGELENMPHDDAVRSDLIFEKKFNETAVSRFLADYKETILYAKLSKSDTLDAKEHKGDDTSGKGEQPDIEVGDLIQWESGGILQFDKPKRVRALKEYEGQAWIFTDDSETGIPMNEALIEQKGNEAGTPLHTQPPILPIQPSQAESELSRGKLSGDVSYRLVVTGNPGAKEIGKLIKLLETQKLILDDEDPKPFK